VHVKEFTVNPPGLPAELHGAGARRRIRRHRLAIDSRAGCRQPLWNRRWVAGRLSFFAASAEAGREFDKLATDLTTPRDSLTREVNLVVSLSRTPPVNYVSQPEPSVTQFRQVVAIRISVRERWRRGLQPASAD
jgi:hypothetical protein